MSPSGSLFVGGTNRGWGSRGPKEFAVERLDWTGKIPLEIKTMRLTKNGFRLTFTKPIDPKTVSDLANYEMKTYTYIYREQYGSPEVDETKPTIKKAGLSEDKLSLDLEVDGLQVGHVHELHLKNITSTDGESILHPDAYYTLNYLLK